MRDVTCMAALDTMPHLVARVRNLLGHGRRMTVTQRYTYVDQPPEVTTGLTLDTEARSGGIHESIRDDSHHLGVNLRPGLMSGFSLSAYASDGNRTEAEAWKRYHAAESISGDPLKRRRHMTRIDITGGLPGDGPARDDKLIISAWNDDGVCDERVVVFDGGPRDGRERAARWLWANTLGPAHREDREKAWDYGTVPDEDVKLWQVRADELLAAIADEGAN
ncbi:hypothetical protein [Verrucosispora sp. NA02020]|uniref:hypothetical protein n=1 Tax=Verrucosispora sp. NA02020 TaxID=2742132 RepID=UPI0015927581|nr:hypothetical protein [Verrucosispora sp. NA02020]QKW15421.1 hypothetical protein HUT12_23415 [Verrucosispora sp. NA02020]